MERAALYRRALAPIYTLTGGIGLAAGLVAWKLQWADTRHFGLFWLGVSVVSLGLAMLLIRQQALKADEVFWSPPTRRVAATVSLPLLLGAVIGVAACFMVEAENDTWPLVMIWLLLYGCALNAAGFFMRRGIRLLGWIFAFCGLGVMLLPALADDLAPAWPNLVMAGTFGGLHLAYGIYLYFTEKPDKTA